MLKTLPAAPQNQAPVPALMPARGLVRSLDPKRLTVCVLAPTPFPANQGTPGSIREMAEAVAERGHDVHIVTYHFGEDIPVKGPTVHRIPQLFRESTIFVGPTRKRPLYDLQMIFKTLQVMWRHPPDLIHAHGYEAALIAWCCRLVTGVPIVYSGHNTMGDELASYVGRKWKWLFGSLASCLDAFVPRLANRCLPHSANMEKWFRARGLGAHTDAAIPFGINLEEAVQGDPQKVRERYGLGQGPVILYAGLLDKFQRLDLLLEAFQHVAWYEPAAKLFLITGINNDKHLPDLWQRAKELGIADRMVVTDPLPLEAVRECLLAGDVCVVSRPNVPGYPIKLMNYMAAKRPCVMFASSASNGLIDRKHVVMAAPDTGAALGERIHEVLRDTVLRQELSRGGHRFVREHHDRRLVAQQICAAYFRTLTLEQRTPLSASSARVSTRDRLPLFPQEPTSTNGQGAFSETSAQEFCDVGA
jgi:glycosyltransferase involved in cell wall biosynthesis